MKKINRVDLILVCCFVLVALYITIQSPSPLIGSQQANGNLYPVELLFKIVAEENNIARKQWTKNIVQDGKKSGFKFGEDWKDKNVEMGPLPALFLREVSSHLETSEVQLGLFLGSDFPISSSNSFNGKQIEQFNKIKTTGKPQFFFDKDINRSTAMFADYASVKACVSCHNEHKDSPKTDWILNDVMGATTWTYPKEYVTKDEIIESVVELRLAISKSYGGFIDNAKNFKNKPTIANKWPIEGYYLPDVETFISIFEEKAALKTLSRFLEPPFGGILEDND